MGERDEARRQELFEELAATGSLEVRNELVESYAPLAEFFANRYRQRSGNDEDLRQVAHLALVKAVDRFDLSVGVQFSTFAGKTIDGELKRYFRDRTWAVRVPRSLQETAVEIRKLSDQLAIDLGRPPSVTELAERSGHDVDLVLQALDVQSARSARSIDQPVGGEGSDDGGSASVGSMLGADDADFDRADTRISKRRLLEHLDDREREIVELRFYDELTQQEIADRVGVSQMHVSRLLRGALEELRRHYTT